MAQRRPPRKPSGSVAVADAAEAEDKRRHERSDPRVPAQRSIHGGLHGNRRRLPRAVRAPILFPCSRSSAIDVATDSVDVRARSGRNIRETRQAPRRQGFGQHPLARLFQRDLQPQHLHAARKRSTAVPGDPRSGARRECGMASGRPLRPILSNASARKVAQRGSVPLHGITVSLASRPLLPRVLAAFGDEAADALF